LCHFTFNTSHDDPYKKWDMKKNLMSMIRDYKVEKHHLRDFHYTAWLDELAQLLAQRFGSDFLVLGQSRYSWYHNDEEEAKPYTVSLQLSALFIFRTLLTLR
jgi:hypothetical protein